MTETKQDQPEQHPHTEFCFFCAPDELLLRGIALHDEGKPWDGPTVHMQVPESFCPHMAGEAPSASDDLREVR